MNKINMLKAVYYIYTQVPDSKFDMETYRKDKRSLGSRKCKSIGCAYGHLTTIVPKNKILFLKMLRIGKSTSIWFRGTINNTLDIDFIQSEFLASPFWKELDNTRKGFCQRVLYLLTCKKPILEVDKKAVKAYQKINVVKTYNKLKSQLEK